MMRGKWIRSGLLAFALAGFLATPAAIAQQPAQPQQPKYSMQEYNDYQAAANEGVAQQRAKLLEAFVAKYPQSDLLPYVYNVMVTTYSELRQFPKVVEAVDRLVSFGDKVDAASRAQAIFQRCIAYQTSIDPKDPSLADNARKAIAAAEAGIALIPQLKKPEQVSDDQWEAAKKQYLSVYHHTAGFAAMQLKEWSRAVESFKKALESTPNDPIAYYRMGVAALQGDPSMAQDGFWALARSVALKMQNEAQVRAYLRNQILRFERVICEKFIDQQMNELLALAGSSADRPAGFSIPSREQLDKAIEGATIDTIITDLKANNEKTKLVAIASCGAEFPQLGGKVFEVADNGDSVTLKVFTSGNVELIEPATEPNMEVKIEGQPEAKKLKKDDQIVYSATIDGYTPEPFMMQLSKGKVDPEYLPKEEETPAKAPAKKTPAKKAPPKKTPPKPPAR